MLGMPWKLLLMFGMVLFLGACNTDVYQECKADYSDVRTGHSFLDEQRQSMLYSPLFQRPVGLACHNCYDNNSEEAAQTTAFIHRAMQLEMQLIELDILVREGRWVVSHELRSAGPGLADVLSDDKLRNAEQLLFLEIKGNDYSDAQLRELLSLIASFENRHNEVAFVRQDRMLILRNSGSNQLLIRIRDLLMESEFSHIQSAIKLSRLYHKLEVAQDINGIYRSKRCGLHMIEFDIKSKEEFVYPLAENARREGLLVNLFTVTAESLVSDPGLFKIADILTLDREVLENEAALQSLKERIF